MVIVSIQFLFKLSTYNSVNIDCILHYKLYTKVYKDLEEIHIESYVVSIYYHVFSKWSDEHLWAFIKIIGKNSTVPTNEVMINLNIEHLMRIYAKTLTVKVSGRYISRVSIGRIPVKEN